jgi:hypothetical protein
MFGVAYVIFKGYLFYRLNRTMKDFAEKVAAEKAMKSERPTQIDGQTLDPVSRQINL